MQLVGMSTGNSCHGNVKLQGSLSCSASSWVVTEWRGREGKEGESTQAHKVEKVLRVMWMESLGKFLIGGEVLGGLTINFFIYLNFLCESCSDGNAFLCVVFFPPEIWRHLQQPIYMRRSHCIPGGTCTCTILSASLPLHKWKWSCGVAKALWM